MREKVLTRSLPRPFSDALGKSTLRALRPQVFINASTSDVVATTSMEALAMGKWLICARHPCNAFVSGFANALVYTTPAQFAEHLRHALKAEPRPLSPAELRSGGRGALSAPV